MDDQRPVLLIVDDQPTNLALLAKMLQADYRIKPATGGAEALALVRQAPIPELVLLDVMMPDMDGYAVCAALKENPATAAIPVIFITGQTDAANETQALERGAVDFIHKPINPAVVQARVRLQCELFRYRQHLEALVQARTLELAQARDAAESANRAKTAFLRNASHEMLTPLNQVMGMTYLLGREGLAESVQGRVATIEKAARNLLAQVRTLLDLANLEAGQLKLESVPFDLTGTLTEVVIAHRERAAAKGLRLELSVDPAIPKTLIGDPQRLGEIVAQLIDNAVKFCDAGEVSVSVRTLGRRGGTLEVHVAVADQGMGLPPEVIATGPTSFQQGDDSLTRQHSGLGMGLAFCKRLIDLMGGEMSLTSAPGEGTTVAFSVSLRIDP